MASILDKKEVVCPSCKKIRLIAAPLCKSCHLKTDTWGGRTRKK